MITADFILNYYKDKLLNREENRYLAVHAKRYAYILNKLLEIRSTIAAEKITLLDIGPSFLTEQIQNLFPHDIVYSLGYIHSASRGGHLPEKINLNQDRFIHFNLNSVQERQNWLTKPQCSIIIIAEVLEHLHIAPQLVLRFIHSLLEPKGFVIIQTPNAVSLDKRIRMVLGKNPYEMIRENDQNPGHFREYTKKELCTFARECAFQVTDFSYDIFNTANPKTFKMILFRGLQLVLGKTMKDCMTIILRQN